MWPPRVPQRDPDGLYAAALVVGIPAVLLLINGAPVVATLLVAALAAGIILAVR